MANVTPKQVLGLAAEKKATYVDLKFMDFIGIWQHFTDPDRRARRRTSSRRGSASTARPSAAGRRSTRPTCSSCRTRPPPPSTRSWRSPRSRSICNVVDPITKEPYWRDPRNIAIKAEKYLKSTGIGDIAYFGPEPEFFIFDEVRYDSGANHSFYKIDSVEGQWNTGREEAGRQPRLQAALQGGLLPGRPDRQPAGHPHRDVRVMETVGIKVERQHHEVATAGQAEIDIRFTTSSHAPTSCSGSSTSSRTWPTGTARRPPSCRSRSTATTACGMHMPPVASGRTASRSSPATATRAFPMALWYIGGILKHGPALARVHATRPRTATSGSCRASRRR